MPYTIRDANTGIAIATSINIRQAAIITQLDPDEIAWAIEEEGRCDALLPAGAPWTYREVVIQEA